MKRRVTYAIGFGFIGCLSLITWASIDSRLCTTYPSLCVPRLGECGGGLDACSANASVVIHLLAYLLAPPILFSVLGYAVGGRRSSAVTLAGYLIAAIIMHWALTFVGTRVLAL